jgi:uncharacterized protein (DUF1330 family)
MSIYLVIDLTIHNAETYAEYVTKVRPIVEAHGGRYLARGGEITALSGDWKPERLVIVEFPSEEQLRGWLASDDYRALAPLREGTTTARAILVEGLAESASTA